MGFYLRLVIGIQFWNALIDYIDETDDRAGLLGHPIRDKIRELQKKEEEDAIEVEKERIHLLVHQERYETSQSDFLLHIAAIGRRLFECVYQNIEHPGIGQIRDTVCQLNVLFSLEKKLETLTPKNIHIDIFPYDQIHVYTPTPDEENKYKILLQLHYDHEHNHLKHIVLKDYNYEDETGLSQESLIYIAYAFLFFNDVFLCPDKALNREKIILARSANPTMFGLYNDAFKDINKLIQKKGWTEK